MRKPIFVRELDLEELSTLKTELRSPDRFTVRRSQIILASARGERAPRIAEFVGCDEQTVRNALVAFNAQGLQALQMGSRRPKTTEAIFTEARSLQLKALLHRSPRDFGKNTSVWTLSLAAEVCFAEGIIPRLASDDCVRLALKRLGVSWKRAKPLDHQSGSRIWAKKKSRDCILTLAKARGWAWGFQDETWWSRFCQPRLSSWSDAKQPLHLVEQTRTAADPDPKALACYGILLRWMETATVEQEKMLVRFVDGRPVSAITTQFLEWGCQEVEKLGKAVLAMVWDNASWHISKVVRQWILAHNHEVKRQSKGVRILVCRLPVKSPWLNPIEPKWAHGKRRIVEPNATLSKQALADRVCATFDCEHLPHLAIPENVS